MLESLFFGFSLAISSHLAVQCDNICFVMLDTVIFLTVVLLHILNHFFIQFSRCDLLLSQLVGSNGLEPSTSRLSGVRSNHLSYEPIYVAVRVAIPANRGGDEQNRTVDPLLARQVLSQLSYTPIFIGLPSLLV